MIILFTGHRDKVAPNEKLEVIRDMFKGAVWLHGGAVGFDSQVDAFARRNGIKTKVVKPDYKQYGRSAPLVRDKEMAEMCDFAVACYDMRKYGGTYYTICEVEKLGKKVKIIPPA